jgi:hypothetical protein
MIYIVDIDQTICHTPVIDGTHHYDKSIPLQHRIEEINKLYDQGHTIIYWTARGSSTGIDWTELTTKQLNEWNCKFHEVRLGKPSYDVWIDDKAFNDKQFFDGVDLAASFDFGDNDE